MLLLLWDDKYVVCVDLDVGDARGLVRGDEWSDDEYRTRTVAWRVGVVVAELADDSEMVLIEVSSKRRLWDKVGDREGNGMQWHGGVEVREGGIRINTPLVVVVVALIALGIVFGWFEVWANAACIRFMLRWQQLGPMVWHEQAWLNVSVNSSNSLLMMTDDEDEEDSDWDDRLDSINASVLSSFVFDVCVIDCCANIFCFFDGVTSVASLSAADIGESQGDNSEDIDTSVSVIDGVGMIDDRVVIVCIAVYVADCSMMTVSRIEYRILNLDILNIEYWVFDWLKSWMRNQ